MSSSTQDSPETYSFAIRAGLPVDAALRTRVAVLMERKATEQAWRELLVGSAQEVEEAKGAVAYRLAARAQGGRGGEGGVRLRPGRRAPSRPVVPAAGRDARRQLRDGDARDPARRR